jgi:two-component system, NtrC family, sensor kinase
MDSQDPDGVESRPGVAERQALSQRLETVGQLAAGIAHEINTPTQYLGDNLRFVKDSCASLLQKIGSGAGGDMDEENLTFLREEVAAALDDCLDGVERIARIVAAMRDFSHPGMDEVVEVDVNAVLRGALTLSHHAWKE